MSHIFLVNLPADNRKKPYDKAFSFSKTINFGLLSIATFLKYRGLSVSIFDPYSKYYEDYRSEILRKIQMDIPLAVGLSCISGFSYPSLLLISKLIKKEFPDIMIIAGGKDHVGLIAQEVLLECCDIDVVIRGEAEVTACELINCLINKQPISSIPNIVYRENGNIIATSITDSVTLNTIPSLDYTIYPNYLSFPASIEVSRGCPHSCNFCVNNGSAVRKKPMDSIIEDAKLIIQLYKTKNPYLYFEAPMLCFSDQEIQELIDLKLKEDLQFTWRAETRVEYLSSQKINLLAKAGLKVIDLGLETGSSEILLRMNKTGNPKSYLELAAMALKTAYENDIIVKINILFYIGENRNTLNETIEFLDQNQEYVQSVSAYPLIAHPAMINNEEIQNELKSFGGSFSRSKEWEARHLMAVNPSKEFSYRDLQKIGILIGKTYQSISIFYKQKIYGYFPHNISYTKFKKAAEQYGIEKLPFFSRKAERDSAKKEIMKILAG